MSSPADIDLEAVKAHRWANPDVVALIAAVAALRIKNKELGEAIASQISQELIDENEALRKRVDTLSTVGKLAASLAEKNLARAEAAEAIDKELAEALEAMLEFYDDGLEIGPAEIARAVLKRAKP